MRLLFSLFLLAQFINLSAQDHSLCFGILPEASLTFSALKDIQITLKTESQHSFFSGDVDDTHSWDYSYRNADLQIYTDYRLNPFWSVAAGYRYIMNRNGNKAHRIVQQAANVQRRVGYRIGHRIRTSQTFSEGEDTEYRLRYRFSFELPLQGQEVDPGEFYIVASEEPVFSLQAKQKDIENRLVLLTGFYANPKHRLESGLDYRIDRFLDTGIRSRIWLRMGWRVRL